MSNEWNLPQVGHFTKWKFWKCNIQYPHFFLFLKSNAKNIVNKCVIWKIPSDKCHWQHMTLNRHNTPLNDHCQNLSRKSQKTKLTYSLTYRFQNITTSTWVGCQTQPVPNEEKYSTFSMCKTSIDSSLVSMGILGTLPGDSRLEDWRFLSALPRLAGLHGWPVDHGGSVITLSIMWLPPRPTSPEYSPVDTQ